MAKDKQQLQVSAILPFYNEQKTLLIVLKALAETSSLSQIILVNDGSRDGSCKIAKKFLKNTNDSRFELIDLKMNHGKAAAVGKGLDRAKSELILMYDADMKHAKAGQIEAMLADFRSSDVDLMIAPPTDKPKIFRTRWLDLLSGERIFYKSTIMPYRNLFNDRLGYGLEVMINYIHRHKKMELNYNYGQLGHIYKNKDSLNFWGQIVSFAKEGLQILGALVLIVWLDKFRR